MSDRLNPLTWSADWIRRRHSITKGCGCALVSCVRAKTLWQRLRGPAGVLLHGDFYCGPQCLETALIGQISRLRTMAPPVQAPNRIPLGLLMVARGKLTHVEVRAALEAQRRARYGKIGEWFEKLGFASERDVTAALALQWGCPVLSSLDPSAVVEPPGGIPLLILEAFQMLPFNYTASTNTLSVAFGERVDHAALYAIERVLDCRTQPCVARRKSIARQLEQMRQVGRSGGVEFRTRDLSEMSRITSSYVTRLSPEEVRVCRAGHYIWLRLKARSATTNLLFCLQSEIPQSSASAHAYLPSSSILSPPPRASQKDSG